MNEELPKEELEKRPASNTTLCKFIDLSILIFSVLSHVTFSHSINYKIFSFFGKFNKDLWNIEWVGYAYIDLMSKNRIILIWPPTAEIETYYGNFWWCWVFLLVFESRMWYFLKFSIGLVPFIVYRTIYWIRWWINNVRHVWIV